jgi:hypothetical protein
VPEAITEGDTRRQALLRTEAALESALAMYVAAKETLPASSEAEAGEEMVPLSALGMAKTALPAAAFCGQPLRLLGSRRRSSLQSSTVALFGLLMVFEIAPK